jgi:hypothetical protein
MRGYLNLKGLPLLSALSEAKSTSVPARLAARAPASAGIANPLLFDSGVDDQAMVA